MLSHEINIFIFLLTDCVYLLESSCHICFRRKGSSQHSLDTNLISMNNEHRQALFSQAYTDKQTKTLLFSVQNIYFFFSE